MVTRPLPATENFTPSTPFMDIDPATGKVGQLVTGAAWRLLRRFLLGIVEPQLPTSVTVGASPATLTANSHGTFVVAGGTVSSLAVVRSGVSTPLGITAGPVFVLRGDQLIVTYTAAPTVTFLGA